MGTRLFEFSGKYSLFLRVAFLLFFTFCTSHSWGQLNTQKICFGEIRSYSVDENENSGQGTTGSTYNWSVYDRNNFGFSFPGSITPNGKNKVNINWDATPPGDYVLKVVETNNGNGCSAEKLLNVTVQPLPTKNLKQYSYICVDPVTNQMLTSALLDTKLSNAQYSFRWKFNGSGLPDTSPNITVTQTGVYTVDITDLQTGCNVTDASTVKLSSAAVVSFKVDNLFMAVQDIIVKIEKGLGDYEYSIDDAKNFQNGSTFQVSEAGRYIITIRDKNGCGISRTSNDAAVAQYPKFFTPNNDGYNDVWKIDNLLSAMKAKISIFDRYGNIIKVLSSIGQSWDGDYKGAPLPADDYWFVIEYINDYGVPTVFKSHFTLKR